MAWIPLLLASWVLLDVLIVATVLAVASRKRHREQRSAASAAELRSSARIARARRGSAARLPAMPVR